MIRFKDVSFAYKEGKWAVRHINFVVNKGEFVSIIGGNGSGKSTIARLSDGLLLPQEGSVFVDEMDSRAKKDEFLIKEKVGIVFQNPDNQFVGTTVEEDIAFGLENIGPFGRRKAKNCYCKRSGDAA
jgi:energy-coupling factor transport system ATP-binding protein